MTELRPPAPPHVLRCRRVVCNNGTAGRRPTGDTAEQALVDLEAAG